MRAHVLAIAFLFAGCGGTSHVAPSAAPPASTATGCARTSVGLTPLTDMRSATYRGESGGLYPGGSNARPSGHDAAGLALARGIVPVDADGRPSAAGHYAFVSIGMSNTTQEFSAFKPIADADPGRDPSLVIVDGAQGGMTASSWASASCQCWSVLDQRLRAASVAAPQVAVAWVKLANASPTEGWPAATDRLKNDIEIVLQNLRARFPNLRIAYLSSRIYAGYATTNLNPEPYAYESAFAVRGVIADQLRGNPSLAYDGASPRAPWLSWGPYLWADGLVPRSDGLTWACSDLASDGTHPSASGQRKVADQLLAFARSDATAREWFLR